VVVLNSAIHGRSTVFHIRGTGSLKRGGGRCQLWAGVTTTAHVRAVDNLEHPEGTEPAPFPLFSHPYSFPCREKLFDLLD